MEAYKAFRSEGISNQSVPIGQVAYLSCDLSRSVGVPDYAEDLSRSVACALLQVRKARSLTQAKMANAMGLSLGQWKKYESGAEVLRTDTAIRWCLYTGVSFYRLFCDSVYRASFPSRLCQKSLDGISDRVCALSDSQFKAFVSALEGRFGVISEGCTDVNGEESPSSGVEPSIEGFYKAFSRGLRRYRSGVSGTQEILSNRFGVSMSSYQQYERETDTPRFGVNLLLRVVLTTGKSPDEFIDGGDLGGRLRENDRRISMVKHIVERVEPSLRDDLSQIVDSVSRSH
ncbi:MAG: transcriptional regulator with XRE-family HTH domain [Flavobacteriales bacterium]|jgi:transcriptional regulator with XRE-family HTH domain